MEQIARGSRRTFYLHAMEAEDDLPPQPGGGSYAALVWATRPTSDAQKLRISHALITGGCRCVVCGGDEPEAWVEAADDAYLAQDLPAPVPRDRFVTTSSHPGEPPDQVVFFLAQATRDPGFSRYVVLLIGHDELTRERLFRAVRDVAGAWA